MSELKEHEVFTTSEFNFHAFKRFVQEYAIMFGMLDWRIRCVHADLGDGTRAEVAYTTPGRAAVFTLNTKWDEFPTEIHLRRSAYHEVLELLLGPMRNIALDTDLHWQTKTELLDTEAHTIIRRLENVYIGVDPC